MKKILAIAAIGLVSFTSFAQKSAHVNFAELVQLAPEADEARATIAASSKEAQETYQAMMEEFQTKYQQYQQKAADPNWSGSIKETKEKELTEIQQRIQEFEQTVQQELQQQQQKLMAPIYEKAANTVKTLAKEKGCVYVFDASTLLYIDEAQSINLTAEARKAMGIKEDRTLESLQAELQAQAQAPGASQQ